MNPRSRTVRILPAIGYVFIMCLVGLGARSFSQQPSQPGAVSPADRAANFKRMSTEAEKRGLAEPFKGITTDGNVIPDLFKIKSTGVSTEPVRQAAASFLQSLTKDGRAKTEFALNDDEWRKWMNQHFYVRQGTSFQEMSEEQRSKAFAMLAASLSAKGLKTSRDIMRLNHTLGELNNDDFVQYGEGLYWMTIMGTPSSKEPWGWQLDGHHLILNYFVLGDQVVMTPAFMGSEPVVAHSGKYKGTSILQTEQKKGLAVINSLDTAQKAKAILQVSKKGNNNVSEAFKDNIVLAYAGIKASEMTQPQKVLLLDLIAEYVNNIRDGHAKVKIEEVRKHIDNTWFAWIGGTEDSSVFYYRIQSPVILVEFDHQLPVGIRNVDRSVPFHEHIHTVVRTPNGNDYGKDLLRQHHLEHPHTNNR